MPIAIKHFEFNAFQENTFLIYDEQKNAVIIDPGCYSRIEQEELSSFLEDEGLTLHAILGTHAHIDHVLGNSFIMNTYGVDYYLHSDDVATLKAVSSYAHLYGFEGYLPSPAPTHTLYGGEQLSFGDIQFEVYHTPGHAPGHVVYYNRQNNFVINGDVRGVTSKR
jgi:glyoxylase-like metal-dependent hydrolase (beta-lactamase superfamily II)